MFQYSSDLLQTHEKTPTEHGKTSISIPECPVPCLLDPFILLSVLLAVLGIWLLTEQLTICPRLSFLEESERSEELRRVQRARER